VRYKVNNDNGAIRLCVDNFIRLVEASDVNPAERLKALPSLLDHLAVSVHLTKFACDNHAYPDPPPIDYNATRALVSAHFPSLGYYNLADPTTKNIGTASIMVGDGIDDLADIYNDLRETVWRWENTSERDALWHLTNSFRSHWEFHLRSLQYYLYMLASEID